MTHGPDELAPVAPATPGEAASAPPAVEPSAPTAAPADATDSSSELVVEFPTGRSDGRIAFACPDRASADALRHLARCYRRREALELEREALARWREELRLIEEMLALDSDGFRSAAAIEAYLSRRHRLPEPIEEPEAAPEPPPEPPPPPAPRPVRVVVARRVPTT